MERNLNKENHEVPLSHHINISSSFSYSTVAANSLEKKLDLKIPEVNFINKDAESILDFIKVTSRENDEEGEGVNLIKFGKPPALPEGPLIVLLFRQ